MSEDKKIPAPPPPDDFSKTTPNISIAPDAGGHNDWDRTNYNFPKQPMADDWGKTVTNIKPMKRTIRISARPSIPDHNSVTSVARLGRNNATLRSRRLILGRH